MQPLFPSFRVCSRTPAPARSHGRDQSNVSAAARQLRLDPTGAINPMCLQPHASSGSIPHGMRACIGSACPMGLAGGVALRRDAVARPQHGLAVAAACPGDAHWGEPMWVGAGRLGRGYGAPRARHGMQVADRRAVWGRRRPTLGPAHVLGALQVGRRSAEVAARAPAARALGAIRVALASVTVDGCGVCAGHGWPPLSGQRATHRARVCRTRSAQSMDRRLARVPRALRASGAVRT
jgi:hypothetical protein